MEDLKSAEAAVCENREGEDSVVREELTFPSTDGKSTIFARWWLPEVCAQGGEPLAVVQLIHGMVEHIGRYDHFASYLAQQGFAVCAHDHIGHGRSVANESDLGCLPPREGKEIMIADAHCLHQLAVERFPKAKHAMFGHSMGSFVLRAYLARHGEDLHAAVVCGTGNQPLALSKGGNALANLLSALRGPRSTSLLIHNMAIGSYGKAVPNFRTPNDWISTDPAVVDAYAADPLCAYMFSVGGYAALTDLTAEVVTKQCAARVRKDLPLLYIAGAEDPVGDFGKGVRAAAKLVEDAGVIDVTTIIYEGMRHEVLNERDKERVYAEVASWIRQRVE
ncbi:MAG: lysophospholipase [Eggerthellaceae bacterium]|nr:lysophospholipase [Eggerthellaceae bacterium]